MTQESGHNEMESHLEQYERNRQALGEILADLRLLVEEAEKGLELTRKIPRVNYPSDESYGEGSV